MRDEGSHEDMMRNDRSFLGICICLGLAFGAGLGVVFGDIVMGLALGASAGVLLGLIIDRASRKKLGTQSPRQDDGSNTAMPLFMMDGGRDHGGQGSGHGHSHAGGHDGGGDGGGGDGGGGGD